MKKNQWMLGVVLLAFVALLVTASLLYGGLSQENAPDNLIIEDHATMTAAPDATANGDTVTNPAVTAPTATTAPADVTAPDFTVLDREGNSVRLSDHFGQGKPIIINFWASWCGPCQSEMPEFEDAYLKYADDITFLLINVTDGSRETVDTARSFIDGKGYTFPIYFDTTLEASMMYGASSIPLTYFLDEHGTLIARGAGALDAETLQRGIDMVLPK